MPKRDEPPKWTQELLTAVGEAVSGMGEYAGEISHNDETDIWGVSLAPADDEMEMLCNIQDLLNAFDNVASVIAGVEGIEIVGTFKGHSTEVSIFWFSEETGCPGCSNCLGEDGADVSIPPDQIN